MRKITIVTLVAALTSLGLGAAARPAAAQEIVVKLGTSAPQGSPWHNALKQAANKWRDISGGKVALRVFPGGTMGDEGDMVQKMRIGQLQAAGLSTIGLHGITPEPQALDMPLLVKNDAERECLLSKMQPALDKALSDKGFVVLTWSEIGYTYFFSNKARPTLDEMRTSKLFVWSGDPASKDAWASGGFKPVVLSAVDIVPSLTTGMIDTVVYTPTLILSLQADKYTKFMMDLPYSTLTGATVIDKKTWDKIPADLQPKLRQVFIDLGVDGKQTTRKLEAEAVEKLKTKGLTVTHVTDTDKWTQEVARVRELSKGKVVPAKTFDDVLRIVQECRKGQAAH